MGQELTGNSTARTVTEEGAANSAWEVEECFCSYRIKKENNEAWPRCQMSTIS